jgi:hypothetical protein
VRVAHCLIDLLVDSSVVAVGVETLDATDDLVVRRSDGTARYEQVKERAPRGNWTAAKLVSEGVLEQFIQQHQIDPTGELVLYTASDASAFREVAERGRNASENHPLDKSGRQSARLEWERRLGVGDRNSVQQMVRRTQSRPGRSTFTHGALFDVLARVRVWDASGSIDHLRERAVERLKLLVDDPKQALVALEGLARDAAIRRGVIRRPEVETALEHEGAGPRFGVFALAVDPAEYATRILQESASVDVAKLPPLVPTLDSPSGRPFSLDTVTGRTLLIGGHGTGKSRLAAHIAAKTIQSGCPCLHVRLAGWATSLSDLLVAGLAQAAKRQAQRADLEHHLGARGALVLDGLDEVPAAERLTAAREIVQFADTHPQLEILVTSRPGPGTVLSDRWPTVRLGFLRPDQIEIALGRKLHELQLPKAVAALAGNPLMLGLLSRQVGTGGRPGSEAELFDAFVGEMSDRQAKRAPGIDFVSGQRVAEDAAFEWLSSGRIALGRSQLRTVASTVALGLQSERLLQTDAVEVERWMIEAGLAIVMDPLILPVHRALLDHLAGRSMSRRDAVGAASRPELREAVARYLGSQNEVSESVLRLLSAVGTDLELLARAKQLTSAAIVWEFEAERFATEYLAEVRRLADGPLADVGVLRRAVEIKIDRELTWIEETDSSSPGDTVRIVERPNRIYLKSQDGLKREPLLSFRMQGYRGAEIDVRVPHLVAFGRVAQEVEDRVQRRTLENEGPDIVYERICAYALRFVRTITVLGRRQYDGLSEGDFKQVSAAGLYSQFASFVEQATHAKVFDAALASTYIRWGPQLQSLIVGLGPENPLTEKLGLGVHGAPLVRLVALARQFGIETLPLHPLGLLPQSPNDAVLSLPASQHLLRGDLLSLYVSRHEFGEMRALRYLVEHNVRGLAPLLRTYASLPWRVEMMIEDLSEPGTFDADVQSVTRTNVASDEVVIVREISAAGAQWTGSSSIHAYRGVLNGAYHMLETDLRGVLSGHHALGSDVL